MSSNKRFIAFFLFCVFLKLVSYEPSFVIENALGSVTRNA